MIHKVQAKVLRDQVESPGTAHRDHNRGKSRDWLYQAVHRHHCSKVPDKDKYMLKNFPDSAGICQYRCYARCSQEANY